MESLALGIITSLATIIGTAVGVTWKLQEKFSKEFASVKECLSHVEIGLARLDFADNNLRNELHTLSKEVRELQSYLQRTTDFKIRYLDKD